MYDLRNIYLSIYQSLLSTITTSTSITTCTNITTTTSITTNAIAISSVVVSNDVQCLLHNHYLHHEVIARKTRERVNKCKESDFASISASYLARHLKTHSG